MGVDPFEERVFSFHEDPILGSSVFSTDPFAATISTALHPRRHNLRSRSRTRSPYDNAEADNKTQEQIIKDRHQHHTQPQQQQQQQHPPNTESTTNDTAAAASTSTTATASATSSVTPDESSSVSQQVPKKSDIGSYLRPANDQHMQCQALSSSLRPLKTLDHFMQAMSPILRADVIEADQEYRVHADLPGVEQADIDVHLLGQRLVIEANKKHHFNYDSDKVHLNERSFGTVQKQLILPRQADLDSAKTTFKNGVLTVTFKKRADMPFAHKRKLEISHEEA